MMSDVHTQRRREGDALAIDDNTSLLYRFLVHGLMLPPRVVVVRLLTTKAMAKGCRSLGARDGTLYK